MHTAYHRHIDGLRAFAVVIVIFFHLGVGGIQGGFVGVDVFFVISGFLITRLIITETEASDDFNFRRFFVRRVRRIAPALLATCLLSFIAAALLFSPADFAMFAGSVIAAVLSVSNFYLWAQSGYFDAASHLKPLLHTWSLSVEEQFYLIWPVVIVWATRKSRTALFVTVSTCFLVSLTASVIAHLAIESELIGWHWPEGSTAIFYWSPFRFFEFCIGAMAYRSMSWRLSKPVIEILFFSGAAMIIWSTTSYDNSTVFPSVNALAPCLGAAMILFTGERATVGALLRNSFSVYLGKISYSLYLVHWPIIVFYSYLKYKQLNDVDRALIFVLTLAAGKLLYDFVEVPFRTPASATGRRRALASVPILAALLVGVGTNASDGWPWRTENRSVFTSALSQYGGGECETSFCQHGGEGPPVIVIGDSFARQLYEGLTTEFPETNFHFMTPTSALSSLPGGHDGSPSPDSNPPVDFRKTRFGKSFAEHRK